MIDLIREVLSYTKPAEIIKAVITLIVTIPLLWAFICLILIIGG